MEIGLYRDDELEVMDQTPQKSEKINKQPTHYHIAIPTKRS